MVDGINNSNRSRRTVGDAVGTLGNSVGGELNRATSEHQQISVDRIDALGGAMEAGGVFAALARGATLLSPSRAMIDMVDVAFPGAFPPGIKAGVAAFVDIAAGTAMGVAGAPLIVTGFANLADASGMIPGVTPSAAHQATSPTQAQERITNGEVVPSAPSGGTGYTEALGAPRSLQNLVHDQSLICEGFANDQHEIAVWLENQGYSPDDLKGATPRELGCLMLYESCKNDSVAWQDSALSVMEKFNDNTYHFPAAPIRPPVEAKPTPVDEAIEEALRTAPPPPESTFAPKDGADFSQMLKTIGGVLGPVLSILGPLVAAAGPIVGLILTATGVGAPVGLPILAALPLIGGGMTLAGGAMSGAGGGEGNPMALLGALGGSGAPGAAGGAGGIADLVGPLMKALPAMLSVVGGAAGAPAAPVTA
jgi:hypothetical protein